MQTRLRIRGITLFECLLAVGILAIIGLVTAPGLEKILQQRQGSFVLQKVAATIYLARVAAAKSGSYVTICPSLDGLACSGEWHDGVITFVDENDNQNLEIDEELLNYLQFENPTGTLHWRAFRSKPYLQITPLGFTRYQNGNFTWCDLKKTPQSAHQLILNRTGRARYAKDNDGDGFRENSRGKPMSCPK